MATEEGDKISELEGVTNAALGSESEIVVVDSTDATTKKMTITELDKRYAAASVTSTVSAHTTSISGLQSTVSGHTSNINNLTNIAESLGDDIADLDSIKRNNAFTPLTSSDWTDPEPTTVQAAIDTLAARTKTSEGSLSTLSSTVSGHTSDISSLNSSVSGHTTQIGTNSSNISSLQSSVSGHTIQIGSNTSNLSSLTSTVSSHTSDLSSINSTVSGHTSQIGSNTSNISSLSSTVSGHTSTISTLQSTVSANQPMATVGDLIIGGTAGAPTRLAAGTSGYALKSNGPGVAPSWQAESGGSSLTITKWALSNAFTLSAESGTFSATEFYIYSKRIEDEMYVQGELRFTADPTGAWTNPIITLPASHTIPTFWVGKTVGNCFIYAQHFTYPKQRFICTIFVSSTTALMIQKLTVTSTHLSTDNIADNGSPVNYTLTDSINFNAHFPVVEWS